MSHIVFRNSYVKKSRKDYSCSYISHCFDWCLNLTPDKRWIVDRNEVGHLKMTDEEIATIESAANNRWCVLKGEPYRYQSGVFDGDFYESRYPKGIYDIMCKYQLFPED